MAPSTVSTCTDTDVDPPALLDMRSLVRKSAPEEALVTGWSAVSASMQRVTVRLPIEHAFYSEGGRYSPMLFVESLRQALAMLTHSLHDVPISHRLGLENIRFSVKQHALYATSHPATLTLLVTHPSIRRRRFGSAHFTSRLDVLRSGLPIGSAELRYTTHPPAVYDRLRGRYADAARAFAGALPLTPPVPAALVGRRHERDVVLSPTAAAHEWLLRIDVGHRVLFDHPHDHVPGMVLLEAASQATQAVLRGPVVPVVFDTTFVRYTEYDRPCRVTAEFVAPDPRGRPRVKVSAFQEGDPVFTSTVTAVPRPH
ncbi:ScbA/BarX family gamma-butyrolactone biosynthesis protein [Kitasatospora sp. NBC_00315]|uniref:ScbA/BarX family gamma-butyrolactone biosynthesis protein n=1 Tax=Kitasatospora sp. NBC_00315 TaxID=2975963 RepID=UPI003244B23B